MANWSGVQAPASIEHLTTIVEQAARQLSGLPLAVLRNRRELAAQADQAVRAVLSNYTIAVTPAQIQALVAQVAARVGGLGFLDALIPPACNAFTDLVLNADGRVWGRRKHGSGRFEDLHLQPSRQEAWRVVEALLAPEGRACSESTPSVDVKIPRDRELGFGGARVKALHPRIAPGDGYPTLAIRLFEPQPVTPAQIVGWGVFGAAPPPATPPAEEATAASAPDESAAADLGAVLPALLEAVNRRLRVMVIGGTSTGKTTLLSALCHGIPFDARIVKVEDPEEIWLPHPNVTTLEMREAMPGSSVPAYTAADGVDDAMRLAPEYLIVSEVRKGDAALSLFRALMSDHAGLTTFHAESPEHAVRRMGVIMEADSHVPFASARELFVEALDLIVQVGWRNGRRMALGVWEIAGLSQDEVKFRQLWQPGDATMRPTTRRRG